ncbi:MAG TPA: sigma-70 family RNA polymerase sigma factor [Acidobacteriota bacterium]
MLTEARSFRTATRDFEVESPFPPQATGAGVQTSMLESELIEGLRRGDDQAYEQLVRHYGGTMLAVARRILRQECEARDALQEAFISVFRSIHRFRGDASLATWLHRIVVNAALMRLRRSNRQPEVPIENLLPVFDETGHHQNGCEPWPLDAHTALQREETCLQVRACIDQLPDAYRTVVLLRDIEELDTAETAKLLGITENAVKIRLHRARQALATLLRQNLPSV